jgi:hypothetical protein
VTADSPPLFCAFPLLPSAMSSPFPPSATLHTPFVPWHRFCPVSVETMRCCLISWRLPHRSCPLPLQFPPSAITNLHPLCALVPASFQCHFLAACPLPPRSTHCFNRNDAVFALPPSTTSFPGKRHPRPPSSGPIAPSCIIRNDAIFMPPPSASLFPKKRPLRPPSSGAITPSHIVSSKMMLFSHWPFGNEMNTTARVPFHFMFFPP